jgi:hypothetical protein
MPAAIVLTKTDVAASAFALSSYVTGLREAMRRECDMEQGPVHYWPIRIIRAEIALQKMQGLARGVHGETEQ